MRFCLPIGLLLFMLCSCDPMRRIRMINNASSEAVITWVIKEDSMHSSPLFISNALEQRFRLSPTGKGERINLSTGVGTWRMPDLRNFCDDLESFRMEWGEGRIELKGDTLLQFLQHRRSGIGKDKILIRVMDSLPGSRR